MGLSLRSKDKTLNFQRLTHGQEAIGVSPSSFLKSCLLVVAKSSSLPVRCPNKRWSSSLPPEKEIQLLTSIKSIHLSDWQWRELFLKAVKINRFVNVILFLRLPSYSCSCLDNFFDVLHLFVSGEIDKLKKNVQSLQMFRVVWSSWEGFLNRGRQFWVNGEVRVSPAKGSLLIITMTFIICSLNDKDQCICWNTSWKSWHQYLHPCVFYSQVINFNFQLRIPIFKKEADEVLVLLVPIGELLKKCPSESSPLSLHDIILCHRCSAHLNAQETRPWNP